MGTHRVQEADWLGYSGRTRWIRVTLTLILADGLIPQDGESTESHGPAGWIPVVEFTSVSADFQGILATRGTKIMPSAPANTTSPVQTSTPAQLIGKSYDLVIIRPGHTPPRGMAVAAVDGRPLHFDDFVRVPGDPVGDGADDPLRGLAQAVVRTDVAALVDAAGIHHDDIAPAWRLSSNRLEPAHTARSLTS